MLCINCGAETRVKDSKVTKDSFYRRRLCKSCKQEFNTFETNSLVLMDLLGEKGIDDDVADEIIEALDEIYPAYKPIRRTNGKKGKQWTDEEDRILEEFYPKYGKDRVFVELKGTRTKKSISIRANALNVYYEGYNRSKGNQEEDALYENFGF